VSLDRSFLDVVFGDAEGYAHFAVGHGAYVDPSGKYSHRKWEQSCFLWPQQADKAMVHVSDLPSRQGFNDVYVCPNILRTDRRSKGTAVVLQLLRADVDNGVDTAKLESLGAFAIASGRPGHSHVYAQLSRPVPLAQYQTLQQGMRAYLNGDNKIADNDLLRPVGAVNYKAVVLQGLDAPYPVNWIVKPSGVRMEPEAVAAVLGVNLPGPDDPEPQRKAKKAPPAAPGNAGNGLHDVEAFDLAGHPRVKAAVKENTGDRSKDTLRIVGACYDDHLTLEQARWVVKTRADLAERLDDRKDDDVQTCWIKVVNSRQGWRASVSGSGKTEKTKNRSVATKLVDVARTLYDLGVSDDGTPYATKPEVPHVALPLRGSKTGLRANLARD
jgi:putative DNA primase/helicase